MNKKILNILCCPICKKNFNIEIKTEDENNIIDAKLYCNKCNTIYLIENSIPNLMSQNVNSLSKKEYIPLKEPLDIYSKRV